MGTEQTKRSRVRVGNEVQKDPLGSLARINRMVRRTLREGLNKDPENIASEIWLELWQDPHKKLSWTHVQHRCWDVLRAWQTRRMERIGTQETPQPGQGDIEQAEQQVCLLMACPALSSQDRSMVHQRFYLGWSLREISISLGIGLGKTKHQFSHIYQILRTYNQTLLEGLI